jgi:tol-pal system protein YbgF
VAAQERGARLEVLTSQLAEQVKTLGGVVRELQTQQSRLEEQIEQLRRDAMAAKTAPAPPAPSLPPVSSTGTPSPSLTRLASLPPERAYNLAYRAMREKKSREAISLFQEFLRRHPKNALAANAQYWLGESHYDLKEYIPALEAFGMVLQRHPASRKVPDALYMSGLTYLRLKNPRQAALEFEKLIERFPRHSLTEKAKGQLRTLNLSGNNVHR